MPDTTRLGAKKERQVTGLDVVLEDDRRALAVNALNVLLEAESNFLAVYGAVLGRVEREELRRTIAEFQEDHRRHVADLSRIVNDMGGKALTGGPTPMGAALVDQVQATDEEERLLAVFRANEDLSRHLYIGVLALGLDEPAVRVIDAAREDEERHYLWASEALGRPPEEP